MERAFLATQVATCLKNSNCPTELGLVSDIQNAQRYKLPHDLLNHITLKAWGDEPRTPEWVKHGFSQAVNINAKVWVEGEFGESYIGFLVKTVGPCWHVHCVKYVPNTTVPTMSLDTFDFSTTQAWSITSRLIRGASSPQMQFWTAWHRWRWAQLSS